MKDALAHLGVAMEQSLLGELDALAGGAADRPTRPPKMGIVAGPVRDRIMSRPWLVGALLVLPAAGCPPSIDVDECNALLTKETLAGVNVGDSWAKVKASHDPRLTVREERGAHQLERDFGKPGEAGFHVDSEVDSAGTIVTLRLNAFGTGKNRGAVRAMEAALIEHFHDMTGKDGCGSDMCSWDLSSRTPGTRCSVWLSAHESEDVKKCP
jgi:hypothetical protein